MYLSRGDRAGNTQFSRAPDRLIHCTPAVEFIDVGREGCSGAVTQNQLDTWLYIQRLSRQDIHVHPRGFNMAKTKLLKNGNSQAVRIPADFAFSTRTLIWSSCDKAKSCTSVRLSAAWGMC